MLVADPERTPLAYGAEDVLGLSLAGLTRAGRVVVRHVGPSAAVRAWCSLSRVTAWRRRHAGSHALCFLAKVFLAKVVYLRRFLAKAVYLE